MDRNTPVTIGVFIANNRHSLKTMADYAYQDDHIPPTYLIKELL